MAAVWGSGVVSIGGGIPPKMPGINIGVYSILAGCCLSRAENCHVHHHHHHHLFAEYAKMNSKICNVPDRKANVDD